MNSHLKKQPPRIICNINRAIMLVQAANKYIFTYAMDERFWGVVVKPEALIKLPLTNKSKVMFAEPILFLKPFAQHTFRSPLDLP